MTHIMHLDIEVLSSGAYESYHVGYFTDQDQQMRFDSFQLGEVISFIHDHYRIEGTKVVLDETIAGQILDRIHIIEFIEQNVEQIIKRILYKKINENQNNQTN